MTYEYPKPSKRLLNTIKGLSVKNGALSTQELKKEMIKYAINDVETENLYHIKDRKTLLEYAIQMLLDRDII